MVVLWWCCGRARCFEVQKGCVFKKGFWKCGSRSVFESCTFYLHDGRANRGCRCLGVSRTCCTHGLFDTSRAPVKNIACPWLPAYFRKPLYKYKRLQQDVSDWRHANTTTASWSSGEGHRGTKALESPAARPPAGRYQNRGATLSLIHI